MPALLPPIPSRIAVELDLEFVTDEWSSCILESIGNLRAITSDKFEFSRRLGDTWTKSLQSRTIFRHRGVNEDFSSALMAVANIKRFVDNGLTIAPYVSVLVSVCSKISVDFVNRSLHIELSDLDPNRVPLITAVPNLFSQLKELIIRADIPQTGYWYGCDALEEDELLALSDSLASLPDLQQIGVSINYPVENYKDQLHSRLHESARLLARASHSLKMIKLYSYSGHFNVGQVQVMAVFDVRRERAVWKLLVAR